MPEWLALIVAGVVGFGLGIGLVIGAVLVKWLRIQARPRGED